ncbi:endonuclease/exonuclease/phosphatase family protein [Pedobacter punctiformis]|uniref:Endonuclease/exonuclease/phosphatase family protein n=1 Tax=Pedobacter punctiformis TaxID=3004097 RepID=A0ABT4LBM4_9SPHI|nr:endonuclease/exonuclease/phosphatase family protein [Pedobacter sp. HCMS5-2]MCZ4245319.1 endonuclease/exonuclease/phosphatase family protein [Pedobacter sp. HCMS5-2]
MAKRKYNFFDKLLLPIAVVLAVFLLLGTVAGSMDPRKHAIIAFFGLAYPFSLLANVIFLVWWSISKKWLFALITFVVIAFGYKTLKATLAIGGNEGQTEKVDGSIRMMTYNVHSFKLYGENNTESVKEKMLQVVKDQNPDIICFQEFYTRYKGSFDTIDSLKALLNTKYYYFVPTNKNDYEAVGLAIFSKYKIKDTGKIPFEQSIGGNMSIYADLEIGRKNLRIYNVHFQSISFEKQDYDYLDKVKEMNTELQPSKRILKMLKSAFLKRSNQVDIMKKEMAECKTPYLIAGDFNDTPASYVVTQITSGLNNAFIKKGSGLGRTYNGKFPNFQIDYIATTKDLEILNYHITQAKLSDHFPVRSDIRFLP